MSLKFKRPATVSEPLVTRKSLLSPDFSGTETYLSRLKPESIKRAVPVFSHANPIPAYAVPQPKYDGYTEARYVESGYIENTD